MPLSRRDLLSASALLLARPLAAASGAATRPSSAAAGPIVLAWNENPYGPSPAARASMRDAAADACRYPDDDAAALATALARHEGVGIEHVTIGTGSGELLHALGLSCARAGGELIAAQPTYAELPDYARLLGATVRSVPVDKALRHDLSAMRAAVTGRTRAVYLCNPNNPTGTALAAGAIATFIASLPDAVTTILDEAYIDFADDPDVRSAAQLIEGHQRVVVLRTFSKLHGMAGARVGYALTRPDIAAELASLCMTSPNVFAMRAARASLEDRAFLADCRRRILASRARMTAELTRLGYRYAAPQGNFIFFDTAAPLERLEEFMRARDILVGRKFPPYDTWCRITIGTEPEVEAFLQALRAYARRPARAA